MNEAYIYLCYHLNRFEILIIKIYYFLRSYHDYYFIKNKEENKIY